MALFIASLAPSIYTDNAGLYESCPMYIHGDFSVSGKISYTY